MSNIKLSLATLELSATTQYISIPPIESVKQNSSYELSSIINYSKRIEFYSNSHLVSLYEELNKVKKSTNICLMEEIKSLKDNWDDYGAKPFSEELYNKVLNLIDNLIVQPKIFPTANNSIQFEYYDRGCSEKYLEFEIFQDKISIFGIDKNNKKFQSIIDINEASSINSLIKDFYELS